MSARPEAEAEPDAAALRAEIAHLEHRVAGDPSLDHLAQGGRELARLFRADEARE